MKTSCSLNAPTSSVTRTVKVNVPAVVGVPVTEFSRLGRSRPEGRVPATTDQMYGWPADEARSRQAVHELYGITTPMTDEGGPTAGGEYASFAELWKPYHTWAVVLVRAAAHRVG